MLDRASLSSNRFHLEVSVTLLFPRKSSNSTFGSRSVFRVNKSPSVSTKEQQPLRKQNKTMLSVSISFYFFCFALVAQNFLTTAATEQQQTGAGGGKGKGASALCSLFPSPVFQGNNSETFRSQAGCRQLRPIPLAVFPGSALAWISLTRREITWVTLAPVQQALVDTNAADVTRLVHTCPAHIHLHTWLSLLPLNISRLNLRWCAVSKACHQTSLSLLCLLLC